MSDSELYYDHQDDDGPPPPQNQLAPTPGTARQADFQRQPSDRANLPTRSSTLSSPHDFDRRRSPPDAIPHARSEDLNHGSSGRLNRAYDALERPPLPHPTSRPTSPGDSGLRNQPPWAAPSADGTKRLSIASGTSFPISRSNSGDTYGAVNLSGAQSSSTSITSGPNSTCASCGRAMQGAFVRALGTVFHMDCFKCMDCGIIVAQKFFPIDGPDGRQYPLCERDYFRRLNLICAKCDMALRGSYITACNKKFHVEHFTCSLCSTLFGPQDSYYEHDGDVYCHYHYSTRFATKCVGCSSAILKQFVEINRNNRDECWHPECYMINKFWNVKLVSRRSTTPAMLANGEFEPAYAEEERRETATSLRDRQIRMEQQVYRIWTVLSAFEESSAACISDMLRQVSNGQYLEAIRMAEKFILHVEVLFAAIDDLEHQFARLGLKGMSHVREARMLCRKTVDLFTLLSHTNETGARRMGMTQELLALVTGLAHYLKILIRIALTGSLKLEREQSVRDAISNFLDKLHLLAVQGGNPTAKRVLRGAGGEPQVPQIENGNADARGGSGTNTSTQGVTYGFRSLCPENAGDSPFWDSAREREAGGKSGSSTNPPSDLCVKCQLTVEEDCVRLGTYQRWHSHCITCQTCGKAAAPPPPPKEKSSDDKDKKEDAPKLSTARRPPANVDQFVYDEGSIMEMSSFGKVPTIVLCTEHGHSGCRSGFQPVSRLEQYAFLLNVALRRLYILLKKRGVVPLSPVAPTTASLPAETDPYRNSGDIMKMKSVHLDRKLSATARLPKRSTIVESPAGKIAHPTDPLASQRHDVVGQHTVSSHRAAIQTPQVPISGIRPLPSTGRVAPPRPPPAPPLDGPSQSQVIRPPFARNNTEVMIVDESAPSSPAYGPEDESGVDVDRVDENGITLADIPQLMEAAQAREQHRSLPRQSMSPFIAELSALELAVVKHAALLVLSRSPLKDHLELDELLELIEVKKGGFWKKLFQPGNEKKNVKKKGVFGVPLDFLVEKEGSDSVLGASHATLRVPSFIDDAISAMRQMDMSIEGIFRKNGNIRRLNELTESIDRDPASVDLTQDNPVQLAALTKKFLRELPEPLLTYKLHRLLIASQSSSFSDEEKQRYLHMVSLLLPKPHRDTMEVLFVFLKWVASFAHLDEETGSKMDLENLATVIAPSILKARSKDPARDESFSGIKVVKALLENQDSFYVVPEEFLAIFHDADYFASSMDLPSKEFLKKCDTYMRLKANGRNPALMSPTMAPSGSNGGNIPAMARGFDVSDGRSPRQPYLERPPPGSQPPPDGYVRAKRQQSPHPPSQYQSPTSYPQNGAQGNLGMATGPNNLDAATVAQGEGRSPPSQRTYQQQLPQGPPPRPGSYVTPRPSGEHPRPFADGTQPVPLRQRT